MSPSLSHFLLVGLTASVVAFASTEQGVTEAEFTSNALNTYATGILGVTSGRQLPNGTGADISKFLPVLSEDVELYIFNPDYRNDSRVIRFSGYCGIRHMYSQALRQIGTEQFFLGAAEGAIPFQINAKQKFLWAIFGSVDGPWAFENSNVGFNEDGTVITSVTAAIKYGYLYADAGHLFMEDPADPVAGLYEQCKGRGGFYADNPYDISEKAPAYL